MTSLPPEAEYPMEPLSMMFNYCPNLMFLASLWLEMYRFSNWSFCWLWAIQSWYPFWWLCAILNWLYLFCSWVWARHSMKDDPKISRTTHRIWHKSFSMIQSAGIKSYFPQSINRLQRFSLLFLSVIPFSDFCKKIKYDKNKETKSFIELGKYLLNGYFLWQYCQEPYLEPNQKSMVDLFCKNS